MQVRTVSLNLIAAAVLSLTVATLAAQTANHHISGQTPLAATALTSVPALVPFLGTAVGSDGKPISGETGVTFLIFSQETGGEPLFAETQTVIPDSIGRYRVQLGASLSSGLPIDLFSSGEARWLEVQISGQTPQQRVLLASVPYALKSADSATLGGLPASAFVLAGSKEAAALTSGAVSLATTTTASDVTTTGGTSGYLPEFSGASSVVDSPVFVSNANVGIGTATPGATLDVAGAALIEGGLTVDTTANINAPLVLSPTGTATAANHYSSQYMKLETSAYNSATQSVIQPRFQLQAQVQGNDTANPTATLALAASATSAAPVATGFYFNTNGTINFAPGQTFPGAGTGTITGVTAGTGLTGGGTAGIVTLNVDSTKVVTSVSAGTGLLGGGTGGNLALNVNPAQVPLLSSANTFSKNLTVGGQIIAGTNNNVGGLLLPPNQTVNVFQNPTAPNELGYSSYPLDLQTIYNNPSAGYSSVIQDFQWKAEPPQSAADYGQGTLNLLYGYSGGTLQETGVSFGAYGTLNAATLSVSRPPGEELFTSVLTIQADDSELTRSAATQLVVEGATNPGQQLLMGYVSNPSTIDTGGFATIQATWENVFNTPLMLQPNGGCVCIATGSNAPYSNPLIVGQGQGAAVADGWATYSSRRFKTDIQTLTGALDKVERMRGVSYTLKATGKREIGVIAEEVGNVVPEVVTYEKNGVDAQSVDYTRLTALLIEATKQQQSIISKLGAELTTALLQSKSQQTEMRKQAASLRALHAQVQTATSRLAKVDAQLASTRPVLLAAK